jgi:hypothetical protein
MRTDEDLTRMMGEDTAVGLHCYYWQLSNYINSKGYKTGIEIGTAYGGCANHLLTECNLEKLICVDPYKYYPDMPGLFDQDDYDRLKKQTYNRLYKFRAFEHLYLDSKDGYYYLSERKETWDEEMVDFVFLDGLHTYDMVKWEIEHYSKLIRPGGALLGHDYDTFKGVKKAVDEYCKPIMLELNLWLKEL